MKSARSSAKRTNAAGGGNKTVVAQDKMCYDSREIQMRLKLHKTRAASVIQSLVIIYNPL